MLRPGQAAGMQAGTPVCAKAALSSDHPSPWQHGAGSKEALLCRALPHDSASSNSSRSPALIPGPLQLNSTCSGISKTPLRALQAPSQRWRPTVLEGARNEALSTRNQVQEASRWQQHLDLSSQDSSELGKPFSNRSLSCCLGNVQHQSKPH